MQLELNGNEIVGYAEIGGGEGFLEFGGELPECFYDNFRPSYFLLENNEIVVNPNYEEPTFNITDLGPTEAQKQLAQITYHQMMTTQDVTALQTQNAQMAYQLMMMQKQGGES